MARFEDITHTPAGRVESWDLDEDGCCFDPFGLDLKLAELDGELEPIATRELRLGDQTENTPMDTQECAREDMYTRAQPSALQAPTRSSLAAFAERQRAKDSALFDRVFGACRPVTVSSPSRENGPVPRPGLPLSIPECNNQAIEARSSALQGRMVPATVLATVPEEEAAPVPPRDQTENTPMDTQECAREDMYTRAQPSAQEDTRARQEEHQRPVRAAPTLQNAPGQEVRDSALKLLQDARRSHCRSSTSAGAPAPKVPSRVTPMAALGTRPGTSWINRAAPNDAAPTQLLLGRRLSMITQFLHRDARQREGAAAARVALVTKAMKASKHTSDWREMPGDWEDLNSVHGEDERAKKSLRFAPEMEVVSFYQDTRPVMRSRMAIRPPGVSKRPSAYVASDASTEALAAEESPRKKPRFESPHLATPPPSLARMASDSESDSDVVEYVIDPLTPIRLASASSSESPRGASPSSSTSSLEY
jgi:hypothetical protein